MTGPCQDLEARVAAAEGRLAALWEEAVVEASVLPRRVEETNQYVLVRVREAVDLTARIAVVGECRAVVNARDRAVEQAVRFARGRVPLLRIAVSAAFTAASLDRVPTRSRMDARVLDALPGAARTVEVLLGLRGRPEAGGVTGVAR